MKINSSEILEVLVSALRLMHKTDYVGLAEQPICNLLTLEEKIASTIDPTPAQIGKIIFDWLKTEIEKIHPNGEPDVANTDWRYYLILKKYYVEGLSVNQAANSINLARARFHDLKSDAVNVLASSIWKLETEKQSIKDVKPLSNLSELRRRFPNKYVPRHTDAGIEYVDALVNSIQTGRAWVIALTGGPGVGKSRIVYELGLRCLIERSFKAIIGIWLEDYAFQYEDNSKTPFRRFAELDNILNVIGSELGRRDIRGNSFYDQCEIIYSEMREKSTLLIIDDLDYLAPKDWPRLGKFLERLPPNNFALLTSRLHPQVGEKTFEVSGMNINEAMEFMKNEISERVEIYPSINENDLNIIFQASAPGIPIIMHFYIGMMAAYGLTASEVVEVKSEFSNYRELLADILFRSYIQINERYKLALNVLYVLPIFTSSAYIDAIIAASGLEGRKAITSLGLLYRSSLVERSNNHYSLLPIVREFIYDRISETEELLNGTKVDKLLDSAHLRLAKYFTKEMQRRLIGAQIQYIGTEKNTIFTVLNWCHQHKHNKSLVRLVNVIGRPLGIIGYLESREKWGKIAMQACEEMEEPYWRDWFAAHDVAWTYARTNRSDEALEIWEETLAHAEQSTNEKYRSVKALSLRNLAQEKLIHNGDPSDFREAINKLKESINIWQQIDELEWAGHTKEVLGVAYLDQEEFTEAYTYLLEAHELLRSQSHTDGTISTLAELSLASMGISNIKDAKLFSDQAIRMAQEKLQQPAPVLGYALWRQAQLDAMENKPPNIIIEKVMIAIDIYKKSFASRWQNEVQEWLDNFITHTK